MLTKGKVFQKSARQQQKEGDIQLSQYDHCQNIFVGHFIPNQKQNLASISFCSSNFYLWNTIL